MKRFFRKALLCLAAMLALQPLTLLAGNQVYVSAPGKTVVSTTGASLEAILLTGVSAPAVPATLYVYDSATTAAAISTTAASTLVTQLTLGTFSTITPTASGLSTFRLPVNGVFRKGVTIDAGTATITATYYLTTY